MAVPAAIASQLASAGTTGMAAAAAISSTKKRKRSHSFETNPSIRKRQQTRLLRKLRVCVTFDYSTFIVHLEVETRTVFNEESYTILLYYL